MKIRLILLVAISIFLAACATSYKSVSYTGGYSETRFDENVYKVAFKGNAYTSRERASDFALLRSAELTIDQGYTYFIIVDAENYSNTTTHTTPTTSKATANFYASGNSMYGSSTTKTTGGETYNITKPRATNTIILFKEKPQGVFSYNAEFIQRELRIKYGLNN